MFSSYWRRLGEKTLPRHLRGRHPVLGIGVVECPRGSCRSAASAGGWRVMSLRRSYRMAKSPWVSRLVFGAQSSVNTPSPPNQSRFRNDNLKRYDSGASPLKVKWLGEQLDGPDQRKDLVAQPKASRTWDHGGGGVGGHWRSACVHPRSCANAVEADLVQTHMRLFRPSAEAALREA